MDGHTSMQNRREWLTFREFRLIRLSPALALQQTFSLVKHIV